MFYLHLRDKLSMKLLSHEGKCQYFILQIIPSFMWPQWPLRISFNIFDPKHTLQATSTAIPISTIIWSLHPAIRTDSSFTLRHNFSQLDSLLCLFLFSNCSTPNFFTPLALLFPLVSFLVLFPASLPSPLVSALQLQCKNDDYFSHLVVQCSKHHL